VCIFFFYVSLLLFYLFMLTLCLPALQLATSQQARTNFVIPAITEKLLVKLHSSALLSQELSDACDLITECVSRLKLEGYAVVFSSLRINLFLAAGQVEIGVNSHDDGDSSSQEGLGNWSESSHTEPLSMTVSLSDHSPQLMVGCRFLVLHCRPIIVYFRQSCTPISQEVSSP
jgi:hypothetical protein